MKNFRILLCGAIASIVTANAVAATITKTVTTQGYVDTVAATKQNKISGTAGYAVLYSGLSGTTGERAIDEYLYLNSQSALSSTNLPTTGSVVTALNEKQDILNGAANTVVTYTGTSGGTGSRGIYQSSGSYSSQTNNLAEASHLNSAVTNAFNALVTCNTYATPGDTTSDCLLWNVNTLSGTYMPENQ